jgi:hypothetical protein
MVLFGLRQLVTYLRVRGIMRAGLVVVAFSIVLLVLLRVRLLGQGTSGTNPSQPANATAAISGVVTNAATRRPIAGAIVSLRFGPGTSGLAPGLSRIRRQLTDALGRFVFRDLPGIRGYSISASRIGFVDAEYGQTTTFGPTGTINLRDGQWFDRADVLMWKPGAISGRVVDERGEALVGAYVRVLAQMLVAGTPRLLAGPAARTDDRGEYRLAGLVPGRYLVMVPSIQSTVAADLPASALADEAASRTAIETQLTFGGGGLGLPPRVDAALDLDPANRLLVGNFPTPPIVNGRVQSYPITFFPGTSNSAAAATIELGLAEERRGADIALQPLPASRVSGIVEGPRDQIAGRLLRLMPAGLEDLSFGSEIATTRIGPDGRFVFLGVPNGTYTIDTRRASTELTIEAASPGVSLPRTPGVFVGGSQSGTVQSAPPGVGYLTRDGSVSDPYWTRTSVAVSSDMSNVVVTLHPTLRLTGRMVFEGTTRQIVEQQVSFGGGIASGGTPTVTSGMTARPFRLPTVYAEPASADTSLGVPRSNATPDSGVPDSFVLEGLRGGEYVLRVNQGSGLYVVKSITVGGQDVSYRPVDLSAARSAGEVVVTFTDQITTVNGFVQGDQSPASSAAVIAFPVERDQWTRYGFSPKRMQAATTEAATGFQMRGLPAGEYFFVAVDRSLMNAWQDPAFLERAAGLATRVSLQWGDTQSVNLSLSRIR